MSISNKLNESFITVKRHVLKGLLAQLEEGHHHKFRLMYSHKNLECPIDEVVDNMPQEKLDWAITQCENSINKRKNA